MKPETSAACILSGLCLTALLMGFCAWKIVAVGNGIQKLIEQSEQKMQVISQDVIRQDGSTVTIKTKRLIDPGGVFESLAAWQARHDAAIEHFAGT